MFAFVGKEVHHISKFLKKQDLSVTHKPNSNIGRVLNRNNDINKRPKYLNSGVYQLWCRDCSLVYTGQTGSQFHVRYKEHALAFKKSISAYAQHLLNNGYSVDHMEDVMDVIFTTHKGRHLDIVEMYYIKN